MSFLDFSNISRVNLQIKETQFIDIISIINPWMLVKPEKRLPKGKVANIIFIVVLFDVR